MADCSTQGCTNSAPLCKSGKPPLCNGCWDLKQVELAMKASVETAQPGPTECVPVPAATQAATPAATSEISATPATSAPHHTAHTGITQYVQYVLVGVFVGGGVVSIIIIGLYYVIYAKQK